MREQIEAFLPTRGRELSQEKTHITHIEKGCDFFGQNIRMDAEEQRREKPLIKPAAKRVRTVLATVCGIIKHLKTAPAGGFILILNPLIQGGATCHRHVVSNAIFPCIDYTIFQAL